MTGAAAARATIRRARVEDAGAVERLARKVAIGDGDVDGSEHPRGFLIPYTEQEYEDDALRADFFEVLELQGTLRGFVLAHSGGLSPAFGGEVYEHIRATRPGSYLVVRQTCVDPDCAGGGLGRALYGAALSPPAARTGAAPPRFRRSSAPSCGCARPPLPGHAA